jgi:hypothetical protein
VLAVEPATRYLLPRNYITMFTKQAEQIQNDIKHSGQRFLVTDMRSALSTPEEANAVRDDQPLALPPNLPPAVAGRWPFTEPVVFRAGRYYVHRSTTNVAPSPAPAP